MVNLRIKKNIAPGGDSNLAVSLGLDNIFNSFQKDLDCGADRDSDYIYGPAKPRTFFISLNYRI
jgi:outer membrane receptor for ferrienterochelin and colicins